jgi:hypothetical protein
MDGRGLSARQLTGCPCHLRRCPAHPVIAIRESGDGLFAQGYLLGRPMPVTSASELLGTGVEALATA